MVIPNYLYKSYLEPDEKILFVCHKHPFVFLYDFLQILILGFSLPLLLYYLFPNYALFFVIWFIIGIFRLFSILSIWYHDAFLITNVSLLDVHWKSFFSRASTRLEYQHIEGVSYEKSSFWAVIFNYGDLAVQRPGGASDFCLKDCMNPKKVERQIMFHQEKFVTDQGLKDAETLKTLLSEMVRQHASGAAEKAKRKTMVKRAKRVKN